MKKIGILLVLVLSLSVVYGQGFETFDNFPATGSSYQDGTFLGQDGSTWTYTQCRGDYEITGKAIMIGRSRTPQSNFYSGTISNGVGALSFDYSQAFSTNVNLNVLINDVVVGNVTSSGEQGVIKNSGTIDVNVDGDFVIKFINANNSDGQVVVDNVEWTAFDPNIVATPVFSFPSGQYFGSIDVEIICDTPGSTIYYTTDGTDPDESSTEYTGPVYISTTTTLRARAYAPDLDPSNIAQASYTFVDVIQVANLAELRDAFSGKDDYYQVTGEVILTFQQDFRNQKYIQDATAAILIDDDPGVITSDYEIGDGITGMVGALTEFGNMLQFNPAQNPGAPSSTGNEIEPAEITISEMTTNFEDYEAQLVRIMDATFADAGSAFENGTVYQISDDSKASGEFRTTFYNVDYIGTIIPSGEGNIVGLLNSREDGDYITSRSMADLEWFFGEPSEYPADFTATAQGQDIKLTWADATGEVLPSGYLILASDEDSFIFPADGTPVANDPDLSDGTAAMNVVYGSEQYIFADLPADMTYYFMIFPYTGSGQSIDFKTDGDPPAADAITYVAQEVDILFTTFDNSWEEWTIVSVVGDQEWSRDNTFGIDNTPCALMTGYANSTSNENEDWLISPQLDLSDFENEKLEFFSATGYTGPALELKVSTDYNGSGNPNDFTWTDLSDQVSWPTGSTFFVWTNSGTIDISGFGNGNLYIAFVYFSTEENSSTWEIDDVRVYGEGEITIDPEPTDYPEGFEAAATGSSIKLTWTDATGEVPPDGYLIRASDQDNIELPQDGIPVENDPDLGDGSGAMNISQGLQEYTFTNLQQQTTYYFKIFPYTNSGEFIDFKTDGTTPSATAQTGTVEIIDILYTTFDEGWEEWARHNLIGAEEWERVDNFGVEDTPCARMSGFNNGAQENEDWLISPAMNLSEYTNISLSFYSAQGYTGPDMEVKISTNYDGQGDPGQGNFDWTDLSDQAVWAPEEPFWTWTNSGQINITGFAESSVYVAFVYYSTSSAAATWEIDNVHVKGEEGSNINEFANNIQVSIYPNPGTGLFSMELSEKMDRLEVFSVTGQLVLRQALNDKQFSIDLTHLEKGLYLVKFTEPKTGAFTTRSLIIQ
jgi:hypothetical protein